MRLCILCPQLPHLVSCWPDGEEGQHSSPTNKLGPPRSSAEARGNKSQNHKPTGQTKGVCSICNCISPVVAGTSGEHLITCCNLLWDPEIRAGWWASLFTISASGPGDWLSLGQLWNYITISQWKLERAAVRTFIRQLSTQSVGLAGFPISHFQSFCAKSAAVLIVNLGTAAISKECWEDSGQWKTCWVLTRNVLEWAESFPR